MWIASVDISWTQSTKIVCITNLQKAATAHPITQQYSPIVPWMSGCKKGGLLWICWTWKGSGKVAEQHWVTKPDYWSRQILRLFKDRDWYVFLRRKVLRLILRYWDHFLDRDWDSQNNKKVLIPRSFEMRCHTLRSSSSYLGKWPGPGKVGWEKYSWIQSMKKRFTNLDTVHPHLSEQQFRCRKWPWLGMMGMGEGWKFFSWSWDEGSGHGWARWGGGGLRLATTHSSL